jgi:hypothetical protein
VCVSVAAELMRLSSHYLLTDRCCDSAVIALSKSVTIYTYILVSTHSSIIILHCVFQVDKQEKRKKKTGRAKRRIQYNRRFVNVVQGFGRRRGPNANS